MTLGFRRWGTRVSCGAALAFLVAACMERADGPQMPSKVGLKGSATQTYRADAVTLLQDAQRGVRKRGVQDDMLQMEAQVPGYGGFYIDSASQVVVWLKPGTPSAAAGLRQRLLAKYSADPEPKVRELMATAWTATVRDADYSLSELIAMENEIAHGNSNIPGFVGVGTSLFLNRVKVGFEKADDVTPGVERIAGMGIPTAAIIPEVWGKIVLSATWTSKVRPTRGGIRIGVLGANSAQDSYGSHGYNVRSTAGIDYFLTASHIAAEHSGANGAQGDTVFQSDRTDGSVGIIVANPPWQPGSACGVTQDFCIDSDVAAGAFISSYGERKIGTSQYEGLAGQPGSAQINNWYPVEGVLEPELIWQGRNVVHKSGFTTGTTTGSIDLPLVQMPGTVEWPFNSGQTRTVWYSAAVRVSSGGWGNGDSGGPVFAREVAGGPYYALGIQFGGFGHQNSSHVCDDGVACSFAFTRWSAIETHLNLGSLNPRTIQ